GKAVRPIERPPLGQHQQGKAGLGRCYRRQLPVPFGAMGSVDQRPGFGGPVPGTLEERVEIPFSTPEVAALECCSSLENQAVPPGRGGERSEGSPKRLGPALGSVVAVGLRTEP